MNILRLTHLFLLPHPNTLLPSNLLSSSIISSTVLPSTLLPSTLLQVFDSCEDYCLTSGLVSGERKVLLRLDTSNVSVVCGVDQTRGEVLTTINHTVMDFIKVDGFQVK